MKTKLLVTGLAFMAMATLASAQNSGAVQSQQNTIDRGPAFVDANKNGICDNFENGTSNRQTGKRNYRLRGGAQVQGQGLRQGRGQGPRGMGKVQGRGRFFVDADKNGVCDYYETPVKK